MTAPRSIALPDELAHYFKGPGGPFQSLTRLPLDEQVRVVQELTAETTYFHRRFTQKGYGKRRREAEERLHKEFVKKGGRPKTHHPFYFVLGRSSWIEEYDPKLRCAVVPLSSIPSSRISFTYSDSMVTFDLQSRPTNVSLQPWANTVFRLEEMTSVLGEYGWPGERWREPERYPWQVYIEVQLWDVTAPQEYTVESADDVR